MNQPVRLGLLGAGRIGRTHARSIADAEGARLVAVADPDEPAAASVIRMTGARAASAEEVLSDPAIEGVLIATPTDLHADQIEKAAAAGKAIFCEKPIDLDLSRAERGVAAAVRRGVPLMIGFNRRFDPRSGVCATKSTAAASEPSSSCRSPRAIRPRLRWRTSNGPAACSGT